MSKARLRYWEKKMQCQRYVKLYELRKRAPWCAQQLDVLTSVTIRLLSDEHFVALLRAEGLQTIPRYLGNCVKASKDARQEQL